MSRRLNQAHLCYPGCSLRLSIMSHQGLLLHLPNPFTATPSVVSNPVTGDCSLAELKHNKKQTVLSKWPFGLSLLCLQTYLTLQKLLCEDCSLQIKIIELQTIRINCLSPPSFTPPFFFLLCYLQDCQHKKHSNLQRSFVNLFDLNC